MFLIYINDLTEDLITNAKLFADNTSLFSVMHDTQTSSNDLNKDLEKINNSAGIYLLKVNNRNTRWRCEIYSNLTYFTPCSSVSIVNFEHVDADWELGSSMENKL